MALFIGEASTSRLESHAHIVKDEIQVEHQLSMLNWPWDLFPYRKLNSDIEFNDSNLILHFWRARLLADCFVNALFYNNVSSDSGGLAHKMENNLKYTGRTKLMQAGLR